MIFRITNINYESDQEVKITYEYGTIDWAGRAELVEDEIIIDTSQIRLYKQLIQSRSLGNWDKEVPCIGEEWTI